MAPTDDPFPPQPSATQERQERPSGPKAPGTAGHASTGPTARAGRGVRPWSTAGWNTAQWNTAQWIAVVVGGVVVLLALSATLTWALGDRTPETATQPGPGPDRTASPGATPPMGNSVPIGGQARDGSFTFSVSRLTTGLGAVPSAPTVPAPKGQYVVVEVSVHNNAATGARLDERRLMIFDGMGTGYRPVPAATRDAAGRSPRSDAVKADSTVRRVLAFDLPAGAVPTRLEFRATKASKGVAVAL